jgi:hypothetical protein
MYLESTENKKRLQNIISPTILFIQKLKSFEQTYHLQKIHIKNLGDSKFQSFLEKELTKLSQKIGIFLHEEFENLTNIFSSIFIGQGNKNYLNFLSSSIEKHSKE